MGLVVSIRKLAVFDWGATEFGEGFQDAAN